MSKSNMAMESIASGFPIATFDYRRVQHDGTHPQMVFIQVTEMIYPDLSHPQYLTMFRWFLAVLDPIKPPSNPIKCTLNPIKPP